MAAELLQQGYYRLMALVKSLTIKLSVIKCKIRTSNHMSGRAMWDKLPGCIFENFEIALVKQGQF